MRWWVWRCGWPGAITVVFADCDPVQLDGGGRQALVSSANKDATGLQSHAIPLARKRRSAGAATHPSRSTSTTFREVICVAFILVPAVARLHRAGGGADIIVRLLARKLGEGMNQNFVVDNRAGAAGIIGCELVAKAPADGYTLLLGTTGTHTTNPAVFAKLPYDPVRDFATVSLAAESPFVLLVHPSLPAR